MCSRYTPCKCLQQDQQLEKPFTLLLLDCWQREYDKRPYHSFKFQRAIFEYKMKRKFHSTKDFAVLVCFLQTRKLYSISLTGLQVNENPVEMLQNFVESFSPVRRIELNLMNLPSRFFELLSKNVAYMNVKELSFAGTPLTTNDIQMLRNFLINSQTLQYLNVANCSIDQYNFALLADGIDKSVSLRAFNASRLLGNMLTLNTTKMAHIVSSLIWRNKLLDIEMQHCDFTAQDLELIAEYLKNKSSSLLRLNLANNRMAADGAEYLFNALAKSGTLINLNISRNGLGTHGGRIVAKYLSSCYKLQYLNVTFNNMGHDAVNAILTTMKKPIPLMRLDLDGNEFDRKSARVIRRLLDARVILQDAIDITVRFDETLLDYCVVPYY